MRKNIFKTTILIIPFGGIRSKSRGLLPEQEIAVKIVDRVLD